MDSEGSKRAPNFTNQDCVLICEIMAAACEFDETLSNYAYLKQRFKSNVTCQTKRNVWDNVLELYNSSSQLPRKKQDVEKKWQNLVLVHKNLYQDYKRKLNETGNSTQVTKLSLLTIAVIDVIGPGSPSLDGIYGGVDATTLASVGTPSDADDADDAENTCNPAKRPRLAPNVDIGGSGSGFPVATGNRIQDTGRGRCICNCNCKHEVNKLKCEKLRLQILLLKKKLGQETDEE